MEGISGIVLPEQLRRAEPFYEEGRRLLSQEVKTVVESLVQAGADEIIVKDAHGTGFNLLTETLHPKARYLLGATPIDRRFAGLDATFDGALLIGYHAMWGTSFAVRDHTMTATSWQTVSLNGSAVGEIALDSLLFGLYGVPVLLVSGDDKACVEAQQVLPGVAVYETKVGFGRHAAVIKPPLFVHSESELPRAIFDAIATRREREPLTLKGPYELEIRYASTDVADARYYDGIHAIRRDGQSVVYKENDLLSLLSHM